MTDLDVILRPFEPLFESRWKRRAWAALLLAGPLAAALGFWINEHLARGPGFRMVIDRGSAIEIARATALSQGLATGGWSEHVKFEIRSTNLAYHRSRAIGRELRVRRFLSEAAAIVLLIRPDREMWVRAEIGPRGFVTGFRIGGRGLRAPAGLPPEEVSRTAAEAALREWIGGMAIRVLGEPEASVTEEAGAAGARRYTWRIEPRNAPQVELVTAIDVLGKSIIGRTVEPVFAPAFLEREVTRPASSAGAINSLRLLAAVFLAAYACYRYARRSMEREAPHARAFLLMASFVLASPIPAITGSDGSVSPFSASQFTPAFQAIRWVLLGSASALFGALLGVAYGAGESEVREGWPGKLTSLDAALTGRVWSANIGVSVVSGLTCAAWLFCAVVIARAVSGSTFTEHSLGAIGFTFSRAPLVQLYAANPLTAVTLTVLCLLAPLAFLRRHAGRRSVQWPLLAVTALLLSYQGAEPETFTAIAWIESGATAGALLLAFYFCDYLAAVVSASALALLLQMAALLTVAPYWRERSDFVGGVSLLLTLPLAASAWLARRYQDHELRPAHAHRLAQRLGMEAELAAARAAQRMLLPAFPPHMAGVSIAAVCRAAREVSGDFYDFFPRADGRLSIAVAEGGNAGLASALTIAMAKGFLLYESADGAPIDQALLRLERRLGAGPQRPALRSGFGMFLLDPATGGLEMARTGSYPRLFVRTTSGDVVEPPSHMLSPDSALDTAYINLAPGDYALICTGGAVRLAAAQAGSSLASLLSLAGTPEAGAVQTWLDDFLASLPDRNENQGSGEDDLTAVVILFPGQAAQREAAA